VLFAFDLERQAILLVGGDKSDNWNRWYKVNVPIADQRFDEHQDRLAAKRTRPTSAGQRTTETRSRKGTRR
jgi:hypothetical protein